MRLRKIYSMYFVGVAMIIFFASADIAHAASLLQQLDTSVSADFSCNPAFPHDTCTQEFYGFTSSVSGGSVRYVSLNMQSFGGSGNLNHSGTPVMQLVIEDCPTQSFSGCTNLATGSYSYPVSGDNISAGGWYTFDLGTTYTVASGRYIAYDIQTLQAGEFSSWIFKGASSVSGWPGSMFYAQYSTKYSGSFDPAISLDATVPSFGSSFTQIVAVQPPDGTTVSSSSLATIGASGTLNAVDATDDTVLHISYVRNQDLQAAVASPSLLQTEVDVTLGTVGGDFTYSTTTATGLVEGQYNVHTWITKPLYSFFGFDLFSKTVVSTSTVFYSGAPTALDIIQQQLASSTASLIAGADIGNACNIFGLDITKCITALLIPTSQDFSTVFSSARDGVLSRNPIGYITRVDSLLTGGATSTLPTVAVNVPDGLPGAGATLDLTPWDSLLGPSSLIGSATDTMHAVGGAASGLTFRQEFEPGWNEFLDVIFILFVVFEFLDIEFGLGGMVKGEEMYLHTRAVDRKKAKSMVEYPWGKNI